MASQKRSLRLKEHRRNRDDLLHPTAEYLQRSNETLEDIDYPLKTNEHGFIDTGVGVLPGRPTIFFVGGSFVESSFAHPERRFVSQIARQTNDFNVINAAYSGTTLLQAGLMIMGKLPLVARPGDVVFLFGPQSDPNAFADESGYWGTTETYAPVVPVDYTSTWKASFQDSLALLEGIEAFLLRLGIHLVIATSPFRRNDFSTEGWLRLTYRRNRARYEASQSRRRQFDQTVREFGENSRAPFLDLSRAIDGDPDLFYDELHLNSAGQDRVAAIISGFIETAFLVNPGPSQLPLEAS